MITLSRNAVEYLKRHDMVEEPARPRPRLDVSALLVHSIPLKSPPKPNQKTLIDFEGYPIPDRGKARTWPAQREQNESTT